MSEQAESLWGQALHAFDIGDRERSQALGLLLLDSEPDSARAHWLLGSIALDAGDMTSANDHVRVAAAQAHTLPHGQLVTVTRLMIATGDFEAAWQLLGSASRHSTDAGLLVAFGEQLLMLEQYAEALSCLLSAEKSGFKHPMLSFLLSSAHRFVGDFPRAIAAAEDTLRQQPDFAHAHWALSLLGRREGAGKRIDRIRRSIASLSSRPGGGSPLIRNGLGVLWHALFRELDALDDRVNAWAALSTALEIRRRLQPHEQHAENRMFKGLHELYSEEFVQKREIRRPPGVNPIFIVGMPRTGTTLVERIITNHKQVAGCGELNELQLLVKRATGHWCPQFINETIIARLGNASLDGLGDAYVRAVAWRTEGKAFMVDKHQSNFLLAGIIARCLPDARVIHVRRDARDACFSNLKEPFAPHAYSYSNDQSDVANHYRNYDRLMQHLARIAGDRILEVQYEDLVQDDTSQARRILEFTGLPAQDGLGDISGNTTPVASASSVQVREAIHNRNIGAWRRYAKELSVLLRHLGD